MASLPAENISLFSKLQKRRWNSITEENNGRLRNPFWIFCLFRKVAEKFKIEGKHNIILLLREFFSFVH